MNKLVNILKTVGLLSGAVVTLWGVFKIYDAIQDSQVKDQQNHEIVIEEINSIKTNIDSLYTLGERRDSKDSDIMTALGQTEGRLIYYIRHEGQMTNDEILDAFELGFNTGKKKQLTQLELRDGTP